MAQITLKNAAGKDAGKVDLDDSMFGVQPNIPLMHQVVTAQLAARRAGTQSTKTRSEVRGGGAKPFRQKGTGNARQGSIRAPHYSGGGVALGPKPRSYSQKTPKKMIGLALRSALSDRAADGKVIVVDDWGFDKPSTKAAKAALASLGIDAKALIVVGRDDAAAALSFRNLVEVQITTPGELSAYDVLCNDYIVFTQSVLPTPAENKPKSKPKSEATATPATKQATKPAPAAAKKVDGGSSESEADASADHPAWPGSVEALADGSQPAGYDIKGNAGSMLYHTPGSSFYSRTKAEVWFDTAQNAEAAGFTKPASQQKSADAGAAEEKSASDESDGGSSQSEAEASPDPQKDSE
jgi:large subunit ribosomal protein L4